MRKFLIPLLIAVALVASIAAKGTGCGPPNRIVMDPTMPPHAMSAWKREVIDEVRHDALGPVGPLEIAGARKGIHIAGGVYHIVKVTTPVAYRGVASAYYCGPGYWFRVLGSAIVWTVNKPEGGFMWHRTNEMCSLMSNNLPGKHGGQVTNPVP